MLFIFYDKAQSETAYIRNSLFLEMKNYSLGAKDNRFNRKHIKKEKDKKFYTLYEDKDSLYILIPLTGLKKKEMMMIMGLSGPIMVPYSNKDTDIQKVWYPKTDYKYLIKQMRQQLLWIFILFGLGATLVSLLAAWYTLRPLRSSLHVLEEFIKDIIHDLNTPLTSILLNLKMIDIENEEIESIRTATQTIEMLHHNLDAYLKEQQQTKESFMVEEVINRYVTFFMPLYDYLQWDIQIQACTLFTDKQAFSRIIYNLLSNACKYNTSQGKIEISLQGTVLSIRNSSYGVSHPDKVFERFYKESERGLGIGLHIVDKLCTTIAVEKAFLVEGSDVIVTLACHNIIPSRK